MLYKKQRWPLKYKLQENKSGFCINCFLCDIINTAMDDFALFWNKINPLVFYEKTTWEN